MKRLMFSILAVVLGAGAAITQSSFKADSQSTSRWGYVQSTQTFVDITAKTEDDSAHPAHGTYSCLASSNICSGDDASMPTQLSDLSNTENGNFRLNP
ncbi:MAG TPA: hypothetical protein VHA52_07095 [Candidatus Babeliaceae bacterium]|nr:hypothetical protein [Candidatus Babeliaceae bacterium]